MRHAVFASAVLTFTLAQPTLAQLGDKPVPMDKAPFHIPVFQNDWIILLNVNIPPGRNTGYHIHYADSVSVNLMRAWRVILEPGQSTGQITQTAPGLRVYVHGGVLAEVILGNADRGMAPYDGDFIWKDAGETRSIRNTGTQRLEFIEFEMK